MNKICKRSGWQDNGLESHKDMSIFLSQAALPQAVHARQDEVTFLPPSPPPPFTCLPYRIKGVVEPLTHVLKRRDITVVNKPFSTRVPGSKSTTTVTHSEDVYKIPCGNCWWCYVGETSRSYITRKKNT